MSTIAHIVASLREISWLLSLRDEDFFRSRAYGKAADALARYDGDLGQLIDAGRAADLPGVGARTAKIVGELHQTGRSHLLSELRRGFPREVGRLARIRGLGLARLQTLHGALGIETVEDLRAACGSGALASVKGFGPSTVARIEKALASFEDAPSRLLLPHARQLAERLVKDWSGPLGTPLQITGAVRRREAAIDVLELVGARGPIDGDLELPRAGKMTETGPHDDLPELLGWRAPVPEGIDVQLWLGPPNRGGVAHLVTTGPASFARAALARATVFDDEDRLLGSAGFAAWPPEIRDQYADGATMPALVERSMLQGVVHAHTTDSDGRDGLRTMAKQAKALGYSYLTITDHSPSAKYARGVSLADLADQGDRIRAIEQEEGIRLLRGTESDIQADGGLDHPLEVLQQLDVVIASIHGRFRLDADAMTARLMKTFDTPVRLIWGHPLGRLVLTRAPIEADIDRIFDRMAERGHILEVNGDPHRMDLPPRWIREAKKRGIPFVLSADAHSVRGLGMAETAVDAGRAGGLTASDVLNTLDATAFSAAVRPTP